MARLPDAFFAPAPGGGQRLYLYHCPAPGVPVRGKVLYVHPWAEEMNKSRRMASLAAQAMAEAGWAVLQVDLLGCGDSSGDFGDATWDAWLADLRQALHWLQPRHPGVPLWLWGLRSGALLCTAIASDLPRPPNLLLWQPAQQGKAQLQQFLRLMAAAQLADGGGKAILDAARAALAAGRPVSVAGYTLSASLAQGLEAALLQPPAVPAETAGGDADAPRLVWLETGSAATLSPASQAALPRWRAAGWAADAQAVVGPPFWQTTEIEDAPALVAATVAALGHPLAAARPTVPETTP